METFHVRVRVTPDAKKESFTATEEGGIFLAAVRQSAQRNEANDRVRQLVARFFGVPIKAARMLSGHRSIQKMFLVQKEN